MKYILKNNYLFLLLFLIIILKEPFFRLINVDNDKCVNEKYNILLNDYNKLLDFSKIDLKYESEYINTYIIFKDIYNYLNEITIRGGIDKELSNNNVVIYNNTLIGVIDRVNKNSSIVKLITNNNSKISVKINDEIGILQVNNGKLEVNNISNYSNIKIGDSIYTSGLGNIKDNIYIGKVSKIELDNKNIEKKITVSYELNIKDIDYVTILKEKK